MQESPPSAQIKKVSLASNLSALRKSNGFTMAEVAKSIGMSRTALRDMENGRVHSPNFVSIARLARLYGVTPFALYEQDLSNASSQDTTLNYIAHNLSDVNWKLLISMIDGVRKDQMDEGYFRSILPEKNVDS